MKRILATLIALFSAVAFGATTVPVQLLNPTGSASGQAIISTGPSTAPAWSAINAATLGGATFAAPGAIGSTTPGSGAFTSLLASGAVSGSGFSAYLASPPAIGATTPWTGAFTTLNASGLSTLSGGVAGVTNGSSAAAGTVGEYQSNSATLVSLATVIPLNATSVSLTAGDWDVECQAAFNPAATTTITQEILSINTTSATLGALGAISELSTSFVTGGYVTQFSTPVVRESLSATTTVYCVAQAIFSTSTMTVSGFIRARRIH